MNGTTKPRAIDLGAPDVPEDCLSIPGQGIPVDLINTCLARAAGTVDVLMAAGDGDGFALDNTAIVNTLWGIRAWLEMARKALNPPGKIEGNP